MKQKMRVKSVKSPDSVLITGWGGGPYLPLLFLQCCQQPALFSSTASSCRGGSPLPLLNSRWATGYGLLVLPSTLGKHHGAELRIQEVTAAQEMDSPHRPALVPSLKSCL